MMRDKMEELVTSAQQQIIAGIEALDTVKFRLDKWKKDDGNGHGITAVIENGTVIEKGAVNTSILTGILPEKEINKMRGVSEAEGTEDIDAKLRYWVRSISLIFHPVNPMAPTVHLNYRYFETEKEDGSLRSWWFGGGSDLTPNYLLEEDAQYFHQQLKQACDEHDSSFYPNFKTWCDKYFVNHHRYEARGIGGIFFEDLHDREPEKLFNFVKSCLDSFLPTYLTILKRRKDMPYTENNVQWQRLRRGRYVEFNLVHDRGTSSRLHSPSARIESILSSLPLHAAWRYNHKPLEGSEESKLIEVLQTPREWA